jgi:hypothetical protein
VPVIQRADEDVVAVVTDHNSHPRHQAWREARA